MPEGVHPQSGATEAQSQGLFNIAPPAMHFLVICDVRLNVWFQELALTNPEEAAQLKRKKNAKKAESRKRKIDVLKPYRVMNRLHAEKMQAEHNEDD